MLARDGIYLLDKGRMLNTRKTFRRCLGHVLNFISMLNFRFMFRGKYECWYCLTLLTLQIKNYYHYQTVSIIAELAKLERVA